MKKKIIFAIILTAIISSCITAFAVYNYKASDIEFKSTNDRFKADNVQEALTEIMNENNYKTEIINLTSKATADFQSGVTSVDAIKIYKEKKIYIYYNSYSLSDGSNYDGATIDIKDLNINNIKNYNFIILNNLPNARWHYKNVTPTYINWKIDTNYGSASKKNVSLKIEIDYE